jgi:cephalosporin-C deacetylase
MPAFELPLEELRRYSGRNPRPADFDQYWDRALAALAATDPRPELTRHPNPARFADCFDLSFTGVGGARIHAKYVRPRGSGTYSAVLMFHGYTWSSGNWFDKLPWAAQGFIVAAMDVRGQGGLSEDVGGDRGTTVGGHIVRGLGGDPDTLLYRQIFLDTVQLARVVASFSEVDEHRLTSTGSSQGGGLALACAALESRNV